MTVSLTFFSPQSEVGPLEALWKKPGAVMDVSPWILLAFCEFFEGSEYISGRGSVTCGFEYFLRKTGFRCSVNFPGLLPRLRAPDQQAY